MVVPAELWKLEEVMAHFSCTREQALGLIRDGKVRAIKLGTEWRVSSEDVLGLLHTWSPEEFDKVEVVGIANDVPDDDPRLLQGFHESLEWLYKNYDFDRSNGRWIPKDGITSARPIIDVGGIGHATPTSVIEAEEPPGWSPREEHLEQVLDDVGESLIEETTWTEPLAEHEAEYEAALEQAIQEIEVEEDVEEHPAVEVAELQMPRPWMLKIDQNDIIDGYLYGIAGIAIAVDRSQRQVRTDVFSGKLKGGELRRHPSGFPNHEVFAVPVESIDEFNARYAFNARQEKWRERISEGKRLAKKKEEIEYMSKNGVAVTEDDRVRNIRQGRGEAPAPTLEEIEHPDESFIEGARHAALYVGCKSAATIYKWTRDGKLHPKEGTYGMRFSTRELAAVAKAEGYRR